MSYTKSKKNTPRRRPRHTEEGWLPTAVRCALLGMVVLSPWLFGAVWARVQLGLLLVAAGALACWLVVAMSGRTQFERLPLIALPVLLAVGLGAAQLVPVDADLLRQLSPEGLQLRSALSGPAGSITQIESAPLSLYPASTRHDLTLLALAAVVLVLAARFFRDDRADRWLTWTVAANGAAIAFFGILQQVSWNGNLFWSVPLSQGGVPFGPFVNRNNGAGYLNLCLAAALAVLVSVLIGRSSTTRGDGYESWTHEGLVSRVWQSALRMLAGLNGTRLTALAMVGLIVAGVLCSLSRGATVAMIVAGLAAAVTIGLRAGRRRAIWGLAVPVMLVGLVVVAWGGQTDAVRSRLSTLLEDNTLLADGRLAHWQVGAAAVPDFRLLGSGLGTYRYIHPPYETEPAIAPQRIQKWFYHAENQYLEALVDGGAIGLALLLVALLLLAVTVARLLRSRSSGDFRAGLIGLFVLISQAVGSFFDFGLYIPSNMILMALLCGAVAGRALAAGEARERTWLLGLPRWRFVTPLVATLLLLCLVGGAIQLGGDAVVEHHVDRVAVDDERPWTTSLAEVDAAMEGLRTGLRLVPDHAEARESLADLWVLRYRLQAFDELRRQQPDSMKDADLWVLTSPINLHHRAMQFRAADNQVALSAFRRHAAVAENLGAAASELQAARAGCPLLPQVHLRLAEVALVAGDEPDDAAHVKRALRLGPGSSQVQFKSGALDLAAGREQAACDHWRQSLSTSRQHQEAILTAASGRFSFDEVVSRIMPASPAYLVWAGRKYYGGNDLAPQRLAMMDRALRLLEKSDLPEDERHYLRASAHYASGRFDDALDHYARAIRLRPDDPGWRYEYALLLRRQGLLAEAQMQARYCAQSDPRQRKYQLLLQRIDRQRMQL